MISSWISHSRICEINRSGQPFFNRVLSDTLWRVLLLLLLSLRLLSAQEIIVKFKDQLKLSVDETNQIQFTESSLNRIFFLNDLKSDGAIFPNHFDQPESPLKNIVRIKSNDRQSISHIVTELQNDANIDWVEPNYGFRICFQPNDSLYSRQWSLPVSQLPQAWDIEQGDSDIIVGVIDTGIDYFHPEIQGQLWINDQEDLNGDKHLNELDLNGIDDDGNGYIDDVIGWDFTNAPQFPDEGDYLDPDNDPMDEYPGGHGTPIAGIIAALTNNQLGMAGIAPGVRVMNLRAGTAAGYLEEDDVAEAIIYAVDNECKVINMSFGDVVFSYLLKEAVDYGYSRGVLFVASAGNSGTQQLHYPASYDQTIAVGATDQEGNLAPFSNYGSKIDLVAPGQNILSLSTIGGFGEFSGTSFSAPIVSGILALLWSQEVTASGQQIRSQLIAGCSDLGYPGWDIYFGNGQANAYSSLITQSYRLAQIDYPETGSGVKHQGVAIIGSAAGSDFKEYQLSVGTGNNPLSWTPIHQDNIQVIHDTLGIWNTIFFADTLYTIELKVINWDLSSTVQRVIISLDGSPPVLTSLDIIPMVVEDFFGYMVEISTDDQTVAHLYYREAGQAIFNSLFSSPYFNFSHYFLITQQQSLTQLEFYVELENSSGLKSIWDNQGLYYPLDLQIPSTFNADFQLLMEIPGSGYLLSKSVDCNQDGITEVFGNFHWPDQSADFLSSVNYSNFEITRYLGPFPAFARDIKDVDQDGYPELLAGYGTSSYLFAGNSLPALTNPPAAAAESDFWASRLYDLDADGTIEVIALHANQWNIYRLEDAESFSVTLLQVLNNPTSGDNQYGIPQVEIADLNRNDKPELILGDYDGDLIIYETDSNGQYQPLTSIRLPGVEATHRFGVGDFNGDGTEEIVIATQKLADYVGESAVQQEYWILNILLLSGDGVIQSSWQEHFYGIIERKNAYSGISVADYDQDGKDEIFFTPFPRAYYIQNVEENFQVNWYYSGCNSNSVPLVGDKQMLISGDSTMMIWEVQIQLNRPLPPAFIKITRADTQLVELSWSTVIGAEAYLISRTDLFDHSWQYFECFEADYVDSTVTANHEYEYHIQTIDSSFTQPISRTNKTVRIRAERSPEFTLFEILNSSQLSLEFDKPLGSQSFQVERFQLYPDSLIPLSVVRGRASQQVILGFQSALLPGSHLLITRGLENQYGVSLPDDSLIIPFEVQAPNESPYVQKVEMISKKELLVYFNHPMEETSAENPVNYQLEPEDQVIEARSEQSDASRVRIFLTGQNRMGSLGENYYLTIQGIKDVWGIEISSDAGNRLLILKTVENLDNLVVFPNPLRSDAAELKITFGNLPYMGQIYIFTANGQRVTDLKNEGFSGGISWDLRNGSGDEVANGVYIYLAEYQDQKKTGKFMILR